jgi:aminoglycoside phosphotransferase (APT) family kinase protein
MVDTGTMSTRLEELLRRHGEPDNVRVTDVHPIPGGYSLVTMGFTATSSAQTRRYVLRADPAAAAISRTDRRTEWDLLQTLTAQGRVPMPAARWFDDGTVLESPAIVLDFVDGPQLGAHAATADDAEQRRLAGHLAETLAAVHATGPDGLPDSCTRAECWDDYVDALIVRWRRLEADHVERNPFLRYVACWLEAHRPPPAPLTLVHGEFQTGNVMLDARGRMLVIDWEYAHVGDPRIDLGWCQNVAAFNPPDLIGLDPVGFCARYCELTGLSAEVVNPRTVAYFSILGGANAFGMLLGGIASLARGESSVLTTAYLVSAEAFTHRLWMGATRQLDAFAALEQQMEMSR